VPVTLFDDAGVDLKEENDFALMSRKTCNNQFFHAVCTCIRLTVYYFSKLYAQYFIMSVRLT
jgi:hypothetical protein